VKENLKLNGNLAANRTLGPLAKKVNLVLAHSFMQVPRPGNNEGTCYYHSKYSKVETIPLSALSKDTTSELCRFVIHTTPL